MQEKEGRRFYTRSGAILNLDNPDPGSIVIEDIGWSLANSCRFLGHSKVYFALAEHAVAISFMVPEKLAGQAFAFSFPAAYVGDHWKAGWGTERQIIWRAICDRFGLVFKIFSDVPYADKIATATELRELTNFPPEAWSKLPLPMSVDVRPVGREHAYAMFMRRYLALKSEGLLK